MRALSSPLRRSRHFLLLVIVVALSAFPVVEGQKSYHVAYSLQESETVKDVVNVTVQVRETNVNTGKKVAITEYVVSNVVDLFLSQGEYVLEFVVDDAVTGGKDYYYREEVMVDGDLAKEIFVFPVASLRGTVVDRFDNLLADAEVKIDCDKDYVMLSNVSTDKYGAFTVPLVPVGGCILIASHKEFVEQQTLAFNKGDFESVEMVLEEKRSLEGSEFFFSTLLVVVGMITLFAGGVYWWRWSRGDLDDTDEVEDDLIEEEVEDEPERAEKKQPAHAVSDRASSILQTLRERERVVVEFLLKNEGASTQAGIRYATKIPKTSLMRVLDVLKKKGIVSMGSDDGVKRVRLTDWFLEK